MAKEGLRSLADEFAKRIPPKQTAFVEYFQKLQNSAAQSDVDVHNMGTLLWLALMRPSLIPALSSTKWSFQFEESVISALQKLVTHGSIRASDTFDLALLKEGQADAPAEVINLMDETMSFIATHFDARHSTPSVELKIIQFLLTAATSPTRAIAGPHLKVALTKLAEIFLFSKQNVNQNAAKAALTQIANERMEGVLMDDAASQLADQGVLATIVLDLIIQNLVAHKELFTSPHPLAARISNDLALTLVGSLNLLDDAIYDRCLQILEVLVVDLPGENCEAIEVLFVQYFAPPYPTDLDQSPNSTTKGPLIKPHLRSFQNKIRSLNFANKVLFSNPQLVFSFFLNYGYDVHMSSLVEVVFEMVLLFMEVDWHRSDGSRIPGSAFTDKDLTLKMACVDLLQSFMSSIVTLHDQLSKDDNDVANNNQRSAFSSTKLMKQALRNCVQMFNSRPQLGLDLAIKAGFVEAQNLTSHALWLRFTRGISKKSLGEYLGAASNSELLEAFTETFDFTGKSFVGALRMYLESFRIPGESQVIERFLEKFSRRLVQTAPDVFKDADLLFQVSYSTLMLNTDMYSVNVKDKMDQSSFVKNTMGAIDSGKELPAKVLHDIYDEIAMEEIQLCCQIVEHPLPLGFRQVKKWQQCKDNDCVTFACLLGETFDVWARCICICIEKFHGWPSLSASPGSPLDRFSSYTDFLASILDCFGDLFRLLSASGLPKEIEVTFERLLATTVFISNYDSVPPPLTPFSPSSRPSSAGLEALSWLHNLTEELGSRLGSSWVAILTCLSAWGFASLVDANHNIRELNLLHLDGGGVESFLTALLHIKKTTATQKSFVTHYGERLSQLPGGHLERIIRHSYENRPVAEGFFSLLSSCAEDPLLRPFAFAIMQRLAREHMPLILALSEKAMFAYLQSLEQFGLQSEVEMGREVVETFVQIGNLVYSQHCAKGKDAIVCDEDFFLKWYHVLSGLSRIAVEQPLQEASQLAMRNLFLLLKQQGCCYQEAHWRVVWRSVIFPLLEETKMTSSDEDTLLKLMEWSIELISTYQNQLVSVSIPEILDSKPAPPPAHPPTTIVDILKYLEEISRGITNSAVCDAGLRLLQRLISANHRQRFEFREWQLLTEAVGRIFKSYSPADLHEVVALAESLRQDPSLPEGIEKLSMSEGNLSVASVVGFPERKASKAIPNGLLMTVPVGALELLARQCTMQLLFLDFIRGLTAKASAQEHILGPCSRMHSNQLLVWIGTLLQSYEFAVSFNANVPLRELMVQAGYAESTDLLILNRQETGSLQLLVELLFKVYAGALAEEREQMPCLRGDDLTARSLVEKYYGVSTLTLQRFVEMRKQRRVGKTWTELVMVVLRQWQRIPDLLEGKSKREHEQEENKERASLAMLGEEMVEAQVAVALEVCLMGERDSAMETLAKGYVLSTTSRLVRMGLRRDAVAGETTDDRINS